MADKIVVDKSKIVSDEAKSFLANLDKGLPPEAARVQIPDKDKKDDVEEKKDDIKDKDKKDDVDDNKDDDTIKFTR